MRSQTNSNSQTINKIGKANWFSTEVRLLLAFFSVPFRMSEASLFFLLVYITKNTYSSRQSVQSVTPCWTLLLRKEVFVTVLISNWLLGRDMRVLYISKHSSPSTYVTAKSNRLERVILNSFNPVFYWFYCFSTIKQGLVEELKAILQNTLLNYRKLCSFPKECIKH